LFERLFASKPVALWLASISPKQVRFPMHLSRRASCD
jgi:hypothetical protein